MTAPTVSAQAAQAGLVVAMGADLEQAWQRLNVTELKTSLPAFTQLIAAVVRKYGAASGTLAARFYKTERATAGVSSSFTVRPAPLAPLQQIGASVDWATQPLWSAQPDIAVAQTNVQGAAEKLVLDVGRQTIVENVHRDPQAKGWARIPEPGACSFCALLATRGAVYKGAGSGFKAHDHCRCHAEPVFTAYEPSAQVREWQSLYYTSTRGLTGSKARNAFRQALAQQ